MPARSMTLRRRLAPLRVRLTLAFASVMLVVLALTAFLIEAQFARDLTARTDDELADRQATVVSLGAGRSPAELVALLSEPLAQVYTADGTLTATTRSLGDAQRLAALGDVRRASSAARTYTRADVASEDGARVRIFRVPGGRVVAVGENLDTREHALARLALLLGIGMAGALLLASLTGYQVAKAALAPVERMRIRASQLGAADPGARLPVPATDDEVQRLAETMNDLLTRLEAGLQRERRIVGDASHELRTPISILRARVGFALRGTLTAEQLREALEGVETDAERLAALADDLLVLARADQGVLTLRPVPLDVQELLESAAQRSRAVAPDFEIVTAVDIEGGAVILGDGARLEQLFDNLVENARTYGRPPLRITARATDAGSFTAIDLTDAGPGIPADFLPHAFERFSQADPAHGGAGAGLGLAIVAAIASAHGGGVRAAARPGSGDGGTIITVELPDA